MKELERPAPKGNSRGLLRVHLSGRMALRTLSLLDQVLFSAANFVLTLILARYYSDIEVAGYGIGLSIALLIQSTQRTCYVVQNSILSPGIFRNRATKVLGQHLIIWAFILAAEIAISSLLLWLYPDEYHLAILCSTIVCSLIYAQLDFDRIVLIKHEKVIDPFIASAAFLVMNAVLFYAIPKWHIGYLITMSLVGAYAILKIARLILLIGKPDFFWGWRLAMKDLRKYFGSSMLGVAGYAGHSHIPLFILGKVALPIQSAAFTLMRGLTQPLMVIVRSLDVIDKNVFQAGTLNTSQALRAMLFRQLTLYVLLSIGAILGSIFLGKPVLHLIYGEKYIGFSGLLVGWTFIVSMLALIAPVETIIAKLNRINQYNFLRILAGIAGTVLAVFLCKPMGAYGAMLACLGGWIVCLGSAIWLIRDVVFGKQAELKITQPEYPDL
jgi:O-antigen/teichoic acid export membrane protein